MKFNTPAKKYIYNTRGVCPPEIHFKIDDGKIKDLLPQVQSFKLNSRTGMAFFGDFIQSFVGYSDFEPFALEMNMVCGLTHFMQDKTVFPAL